MNPDLILASMLGALLRDLQVWAAGRICAWRQRRQALRVSVQPQPMPSAASQLDLVERVKAYPFILAVNNDHQFILASREIVCSLRQADKRRFFCSESTEQEYIN